MFNHLLSLELQGYKTFAMKTDFRFPSQLTAIVGPNGSGKSNIADAIRWVLGEQAYSLLRGRKTIDMIFSGSKQRPRASMASVSIVLDNQSGWLPIEYSEVNITRRAYRNGENEYLINNERVRLKEINELLANSGLGERNYTVIGQGLVDSALSLRPEDRRRFIEEAAGIGLYRSRRVEAIQKLDKTARNIERINDILTELEPRIRLLEKQQEKTKKYLQIDTDLKLLLNDWYGYHWHTVQKNLKTAQEFNAQQQAKLDQSREFKQGLEKQFDQSQDSLQKKREKLSGLHSQLSKLHDENEDKKRELAVLEEREKAQKSRILEIENRITTARDKKSILESEIAELNNQSKSDQLEFQTAKESLEKTDDLLQKRLTQRSKVNTLIYEKEKKLNIDQQEHLRLMTLIEGLKNQLNLQYFEVEKLKTNSKETKKGNERIGIELERLNNREKNLALEIKSIDEEISGIKEALDAVENEIEDLLNQKHRREKNLIKLKTDFNLLVEAEKAMTGYSSGAKSIFKAVRTGKISGDISFIMDYIDVPKEYDIAIAAILGAAIEGLVVKPDSDVDSILDLIKSNKIQRTILVLNKKSAHEFITKRIPGSFTIASEIVTADERLEPFIHNLLSSSLIVNDRRVAVGLLPKLPLGYRVVTKDGEVYASDQTITAGKEPRIRSFTRKREKQALTVEIKNSNDELKQISGSLGEGTVKKDEFQRRLEEFINRRNAEVEKVNKLSLEVHKLEIEQDQRKKQVEKENNHSEEILARIKSEETNISELERKAIGLGEEISAQKVEIEKHYNNLKELSLEELRSMITSLSSKYAAAEQIAQNNHKRIQERNKILTANQELIDQNKIKQIELKNKLEEIRKEIEVIKKSYKETSDKVDSQSVEKNDLEKTVENEIANQGKFLEEVDDSRRKFAVAERHKLQAQMKVEKLRDKIEGYEKKIRTDFGILMEGEEDSTYSPKPLPLSGIVASLPKLNNLPENLNDQISRQRSMLRRIGPINPNAQDEFEEVNNRYIFLSEQLQDLEKAEQDLRAIVNELDGIMKKEFMKTFNNVGKEFKKIFRQLFNGGEAKLIIEDEENILDSGINIEATLPARRRQELALLSGGERSLTAIALIFSLLKISPPPFCILDEIDAMLDESNVMRVGELLKELSDTTQFVIITHNRNTVQLADILYGVTMGKDSVSQVISLKLDELTDDMVQ